MEMAEILRDYANQLEQNEVVIVGERNGYQFNQLNRPNTAIVRTSMSTGKAAKVRYDSESFIELRISQRIQTYKVKARRFGVRLLSWILLRRVING